MVRIRTWTLAILAIAAAGCGAPHGEITREPPISLPSGEDFGAGLTLGQISELDEIISRPEDYSDGPVLVSGKVSEVCQRKGCWMILRGEEAETRVTFKDYGFFVPKNCSGRVAYVEGEVQREVISERLARHYAEESSLGHPDEIQGAQEVVSFVASGVRLVSSP
jgi:hypothetical protein